MRNWHAARLHTRKRVSDRVREHLIEWVDRTAGYTCSVINGGYYNTFNFLHNPSASLFPHLVPSHLFRGSDFIWSFQNFNLIKQNKTEMNRYDDNDYYYIRLWPLVVYWMRQQVILVDLFGSLIAVLLAEMMIVSAHRMTFWNRSFFCFSEMSSAFEWPYVKWAPMSSQVEIMNFNRNWWGDTPCYC